MKFSAAALFSLASFVPAVLGHGFVRQMRIGGKIYQGTKPYGSYSKTTPIRHITTVNPITNVNGGEMTCGWGAKANTATVVAPATPGSTLEFWWASGQGNWGHSAGPIMTYMAKCPSSGCVSWDPKDAAWFKISQTGRKSGSTAWFQADIKAGKSYTTKIPTNIPSGDYIVRHELIALHFAEITGGAQFYPSCSQIRITGGSSGTTLRSANGAPSAKFPGGYHANDAGIKLNAYTSKGYTFPGPKVATFSGSGGSGGSDPVVTPTTTTTVKSSKPTTTTKAASNPQTTKKGNQHVVTSTTQAAPPAQTTTPTKGGSGGCKQRRKRNVLVSAPSAKFNNTARSSVSSSESREGDESVKRGVAPAPAMMKRREGEGNKVHWRVARGRAMSQEVETLALYRRAHQKRAEELENEFYDD